MARRPDTPCTGCGKLLWSGTSSLPADQRMCNACRRSRRKHRPHRPPRSLCAEPGCVKRPIGNVRCWWHRPERAEYMRARYRERTHHGRIRDEAERHTDITPEYERSLRAKAKRCPLCNVRLVKKPYLPASKELDHIIPLNVHGTHTVGNVRIICRSCNQRRPLDGSDYEGPLTLWAQAPGFIPKPTPQPTRQTYECGRCGSALSNGACQPCRERHAQECRERGLKAADMRAAGVKWQDIANALGFGSPGSAYVAADKWGARDVKGQWPRDNGYQRRAA